MPRRISRLGGTTLRRSFITNAYSPAIIDGAPRWCSPYPSVLRCCLTPSQLGGAQQPSVLRHHASILHDAYAGARERLRGGVVADAELKPDHGRRPRQPDDLRRVRLQVLRTAKHFD